MNDSSVATFLSVTPDAEKKIQALFSADPDSKGKSLRIGLEPGGCSGFQYAFSFDARKEGDAEIPCAGFSILVDAQSAPYLNGSVLDYSESSSAAGFKIGNPNVKKSCGCGQSNSF